MSVDDLHAFFNKLVSDEELRREVIALDAATAEERFAALQALAARDGLEVTSEDWQHESVGPAVAALEDEELKSVVAAGCGDNAGLAGGSVGFGTGGCGSVGAYGAGCGSVGAAGGSCG
jgi:predicted ribosomally synthesized peptide with nif11-like leader